MTDSHQKVQPIPAQYGSITPYISVRGVPQFIDFLKAAFGAVERGRVPNADGMIGHAEVLIGNSVIQMFHAKASWPDTPSFITLYVEDCDAIYQRALDAGAASITPLGTNAWGDRMGRVRDPFGNIWWISTHVEDVDPAEAMKRMNEPEYLNQMRMAQETLDHELSGRK